MTRQQSEPVWEQRMRLPIPVSCLTIVLDALRQAGKHEEAAYLEEQAADYVDPELNAEREAWIAQADNEHGRDGEIEFDSDSAVSRSDEGAYVLAWVWVYASESEEDTNDNEPASSATA